MSRLVRVLADAFNIVIRNPVVSGFPRLSPLSRAGRQVVISGLLLTSVTALLIGFGDSLRSMSTLQRDTSAETVLFVPSLALVFVPYLVSCALGLMLVGAIRADWRATTPVVAVYLLVQFALIRLTRDAGVGTVHPLVVLCLALIVIAVCIFARRGAISMGIAAGILFASSTISMLVVTRALHSVSVRTGESFDIVVLQVVLQALALLCLPMVFVAGLDATKFSIVAANWLSEQVSGLRGRAAVWGVAILVFVASVVQSTNRIQDWMSSSDWHSLLSVVICGLGVVGVWRVARSVTGRQTDDSAVRSAQSLALFVSALVVAVPMLIQVVGLVQVIAGLSSPISTGVLQAMIDVLLVDSLAPFVRLLVGTGLMVAGWRRDLAPLARVTAVASGFVIVVDNASRLSGRSPLTITAEHLDVVLVVGVALFLASSVSQRRLTSSQVASAAGLLVLSGVASQNAFAAGPLATLLPLGGLSLLLFGLFWGVFTGAGDANESSPEFPSESRLMLFAGYQLLTVSIVLWAVLTRDTTLTDQLTSSTELGVRTLGVGLLAAIIAGHARESGFMWRAERL